VPLALAESRAVGPASVLKHQIGIARIHVTDVSPVTAIIIVWLVAPGARIEGVGIGLLERAVSNVDRGTAASSGTAIGAWPAVDVQHGCRDARLSRMHGIVGGARRRGRNDHRRGEYNKTDIGS